MITTQSVPSGPNFPHSGEGIRIEPWVVAQPRGQTVASNVGHAESWDQLTIDDDIAARDCLLRYKRKGRVLAVASIYRDTESLAEHQMRREATA
jgi:hypothetical protein